MDPFNIIPPGDTGNNNNHSQAQQPAPTTQSRSPWVIILISVGAFVTLGCLILLGFLLLQEDTSSDEKEPVSQIIPTTNPVNPIESQTSETSTIEQATNDEPAEETPEIEIANEPVIEQIAPEPEPILEPEPQPITEEDEDLEAELPVITVEPELPIEDEIEESPTAHSPAPSEEEKPPEEIEPEPEENNEENSVDNLYPLINDEIKQLAQEMGLTDYAKHVFYAHDPQIIDDPEQLAQACGSIEIGGEGVIHGCWFAEPFKIYALRHPSLRTTMAHELLHALYYDRYNSYQGLEFKQYIDKERERHSGRVNEILKPYYESPHYDLLEGWEYNELHSFFGSEFHVISPELETHYANFFEDRQKIVNFYAEWQQSEENKRLSRSGLQYDYRQQDREYSHCINVLLDRNACQELNPEIPYQTYQDCLRDHFTWWSDCQVLQPALITFDHWYNSQTSI